jgi:hypothetical protein
MEEEIWAEHPHYKGWYGSSIGRVKSSDRMIQQRNRWGSISSIRINGQLLSTKATTSRGYVVFRGPNHKTTYLSTFLLECFFGDRPTDDHEGAHWDGDKQNNRLDNLRWATRKENAADRIRHGHQVKVFGPTNVLTKFPTETIVAVRESTGRVTDIAKKFGISHSQVSRIRRGLTRQED